jgi:hypothetical protein
MYARSTETDFESLAELEMKRFHLDCSRYRLRGIKTAGTFTVVVFDGDRVDGVEPCVIVSFAPAQHGWTIRLELRHLRPSAHALVSQNGRSIA